MQRRTPLVCMWSWHQAPRTNPFGLILRQAQDRVRLAAYRSPREPFDTFGRAGVGHANAARAIRCLPPLPAGEGWGEGFARSALSSNLKRPFTQTSRRPRAARERRGAVAHAGVPEIAPAPHRSRAGRWCGCSWHRRHLPRRLVVMQQTNPCAGLHVPAWRPSRSRVARTAIRQRTSAPPRGSNASLMLAPHDAHPAWASHDTPSRCPNAPLKLTLPTSPPSRWFSPTRFI
jgi:hypothetical protein